MVHNERTSTQKVLQYQWYDIQTDEPERQLKEMTEDDQLKLLATDGMLVKRPLVIGDNFVLTGFKEKEWEEKLL